MFYLPQIIEQFREVGPFYLEAPGTAVRRDCISGWLRRRYCFNHATILNLRAFLANNLLADPRAPGRPGYVPEGIVGYIFHSLKATQPINECTAQILDTADANSGPFEQAIFRYGATTPFATFPRRKYTRVTFCREYPIDQE